MFFCFLFTAWRLFVFYWISIHKWLQQTNSTSYLPITAFNDQNSQNTLAQRGLCYISVLYVMVVVSVKFYLELCLRLQHGCGMIWGIVSLIASIGSKKLKSFSVVSRNTCTTKLQSQGKCWQIFIQSTAKNTPLTNSMTLFLSFSEEWNSYTYFCRVFPKRDKKWWRVKFYNWENR